MVVYTGMKETTAKIADGVELYAENGLVVWARSENHIYANVIGAAAGGSAGVGATVSVIVLQDMTTASVGGSLTAGSVTVKAEAYENLQLSATSAAGSGTVGVGAQLEPSCLRKQPLRRFARRSPDCHKRRHSDLCRIGRTGQHDCSRSRRERKRGSQWFLRSAGHECNYKGTGGKQQRFEQR